MAFKVTIIIECDEPNEIVQHLDKLKKDIKADVKRHPDKYDDLTVYNDPIRFEDSNCYGEHDCSISVLD